METFNFLLGLLFPKSVLPFIGLFCALAIMLAGLGIVERLRHRNEFTVTRILRNMALVALVPSLVTIIIHVIAVYLQRFFNQLDATTQNEIVVAGATLVVGTSAFFVKLQRQFFYGLVELIAAVLFVVNAVANNDANHPNDLAVGSAAIASLYVVVRGLTNMTEGSLGKVESFNQFIEKLFAKLGIQASPSVSSNPQIPQ